MRSLREEAHRTVEGQRATLDEMDEKAIKILRVNVIVLGVIVSLLSLTGPSGPVTDDGSIASAVVSGYTAGGVVSIIASTLFATLTYTMSNVDIGINQENIISIIQADVDVRETELLLCKNYASRINFNRSTMIRQMPLVQLTVLLFYLSVILFGLALYHGLGGTISHPVHIVVGLLVVCIVGAVGLPQQLYRALHDWWLWRRAKIIEGSPPP
ncbi:MAG: hypothetical protein U5K37_08775 [Natrialbaceae archaeon]|nr:hypothetical protein [Natrialbaceae archaeon]